MAKQNIESVVVNTKTIASMFGLTDRRVRQLVDEGIIDRVGHGRFSLIDTVNRYVSHLKLSGEAGMDESQLQESLDYEKYLHEKAKREKAEIELAHIKGKMHHASEVEKVMNKMLSDFRAKLLALPSKVAPSLIARDEIAMIEKMIQKDIYEVLQELSEYDASMFADVSEDEDEEEENNE